MINSRSRNCHVIIATGFSLLGFTVFTAIPMDPMLWLVTRRIGEERLEFAAYAMVAAFVLLMFGGGAIGFWLGWRIARPFCCGKKISVVNICALTMGVMICVGAIAALRTRDISLFWCFVGVIAPVWGFVPYMMHRYHKL